MAGFIPPDEVTSPRRQWSLIQVLDDPRRAGECVLALGRWENKPVLAMRWNDTEDNPIGNPQSRGLPTWFIVPEKYNRDLLQTLPTHMRDLAYNFLPGPDSLWLVDITSELDKFGSDRWTITSGPTRGPAGEKLVTVTIIDGWGNGREVHFDVTLSEGASHEEVRAAFRKAVKRYVKSHPATRGARTIR